VRRLLLLPHQIDGWMLVCSGIPASPLPACSVCYNAVASKVRGRP
jgi:hypothetical protein